MALKVALLLSLVLNKKELPVITNVTIDSTSIFAGIDTVAWSKATEIDTNKFPPPYMYKIYRSPDFFGSSFKLLSTPVLNENDTIYKDTLIDTESHPWSYKVELYYDSAHLGTPVLKGRTQTASSVFLKLTPTDKKMILAWEEHVPWTNSYYDIFKWNKLNLTWDSIGTANAPNRTFTDDSLINGDTVCYYVRSVGSYGTQGIVDPIINLSQQACGVPVDNVPPCPPQLTVSPDCIEEKNVLQWNNPNNSCASDVMSYNIYFAADSVAEFTLLDTINNANDTIYVHGFLTTLTGCYKVTAIDTVGNESSANMFCVDTCRQYVLPSVFTPNGDGNNDFFHPCDSTTAPDLQKKNCPPYKNVKSIDIKIFNRWGNLVFETTNKDINWDGKNKFTKGDCPDGVYYYTCKVNFIRLNGTETKELHGYVHLLRAK